ncbi:MAG: DUF4936 family protein [Betaproteobacteria bacterium]
MVASAAPDLLDLFVYYRVPASQESAHLAQTRALLAELRQRSGVEGRLSRRPEAKEGLHTWMESFIDLPAAQEAAVKDHLADPRGADFIAGERHSERFVRLA